MATATQPARVPGLPAALVALRSVAPLLVGLMLAGLVHFVVGPNLNLFYVKLLTDIGIGIVAAVSLNIVNGLTGQFSIGHAGFMAVGGYMAALVMYYGSQLIWGDAAFHGGILSWPTDLQRFDGPWLSGADLLFPTACLAGGLLAAAAGVIVGLPSLRLRGDYLAIVTLGFGEIIRVLLQQTDDVLFDAAEIRQTSLIRLLTKLGGTLGFTGLPYYTSLFWTYAFVASVLIVAFRLKQSSYGRAFLSIREDEIAAEAMGVPTTRLKVLAFTLSAFFAGIAGGLFAHEVGITLNPQDLGFMKSFDIVIMVVLGGMGSISGVTLAAVLLTILPELLRKPPPVWPLGVAAAVVIVALRGRAGGRAAVGWLLAGLALEWLRRYALAHDINPADYRMIIYALSLIMMMILRPQGLFGLREIWEFLPRRVRPRAAVPT